MRTLRPRRTLGWSIGLPFAALAVPFLAVEAWVLGTRDAWAIAVWSVIVVAVLSLAAWIAYRRTRVSISRYGIVEHGFFGGVSIVPVRDIAGVLRTQVYRANSLDTTNELFVVHRSGRSAFRMRGRFWDERTMDLVAKVLDVQETVHPEPVTLAELRESNPELLYWFERRSLLH